MSTATILLVDDEIDHLVVIGALIERAGFNVITANSSDEAKQALLSGTIDLLVADLCMPGFSGTDLISFLLKSNPLEVKDPIPAILITASDVYPEELAAQHGAASFCLKRLIDTELVPHINSLLRKRRPKAYSQTSGSYEAKLENINESIISKI